MAHKQRTTVFAVAIFAICSWAISSFEGPRQDDMSSTDQERVGVSLAISPTIEKDFGSLCQEGGAVSHSFEYKNRSIGPIKLKLRYKSCACVELEFPEAVRP